MASCYFNLILVDFPISVALLSIGQFSYNIGTTKVLNYRISINFSERKFLIYALESVLRGIFSRGQIFGEIVL